MSEEQREEEGRCPVTDWATDYDIMDPDYVRDPAPYWDDLRERCPIAHTDRWGGSWMPTRYADLQEMVRMVPALSSASPGVIPPPEELREQLISERRQYGSENPPITADPPEQKPYKQLILPFFTPKAVAEYRPITEQLCHDLMDRVIAKGNADAAADYAEQIPPRVIAHMMGIDHTRADEFVEWTRGLLELGQSRPKMRIKYRNIIRDFFADLVTERRANPGDDMISTLIDSEVEGKPLTDYTVIGICNLILLAGIDTTWSSIGASLWHLAGHREDRQRLYAEPELFPSAVEELLRFYSPVKMGRKVTEPVTMGDVTMQPGDKVILNFPAANRDPEVFDRPNEVVLDRQKNRHIAFGIGIHRCAGSNLARMEMEVGLRIWFERTKDFELTDADAVRWAGGQVRGPRIVPVRVTA